MFSNEEKEKANAFKFALYPMDLLTDYINGDYFTFLDQSVLDDEPRQLPPHIPKKIIQYWHTARPPFDVQNAIGTLRAHNNTFDYELFNEATAGEFIEYYYGSHYRKLFDKNCVHHTMKSDFFRNCYLLKQGGFYVDVDIRCFNGLDAIICNNQFDCFLFYSEGEPYCIDNNFIVCVPENPIIEAILRKQEYNLTAHQSFPDVWSCTGPGATSIAIMEILVEKILEDREKTPLDTLKLGPSHLAGRSYEHAELAYKRNSEGNWRLFRFPRKLYRL